MSFDAARLADAPNFPGMAVLTVALLAVTSFAVLASSAHAVTRLRDAHLHAAVAPGPLLAAFGLPLLLGQLRGLLALVVPDPLATASAVVAFATALAAVAWRILARLQAFQVQRERMMADLEARVEERTRELAQANQQLHDSEGRLREADRRKDEFLATLAHELRNPLAPIRTGLEILKSDGLSGDAAARGARGHRPADAPPGATHRRPARREPDHGQPPRSAARAGRASSEVLYQSVETSRADLDRAGHRLTLDLPAEPAYVLGDPTRLTQIVSNLLQNACKYTPRGGHMTLAAIVGRRADRDCGP